MHRSRFLAILVFVLIYKWSYSQNNEYVIKGVFMSKFARFIEWPNMNDDSFKIAILGDSPFGNILDTLYENKTIRGLSVSVSYISRIQDGQNSHIVFVCKSHAGKIKEIVSTYGNSPVLIIGESSRLANRGAHINFFITEQETIHFEINPLNLKKAHLKIDALLLNHAILVGQ